jgi:hypothetical protein
LINKYFFSQKKLFVVDSAFAAPILEKSEEQTNKEEQ